MPSLNCSYIQRSEERTSYEFVKEHWLLTQWKLQCVLLWHDTGETVEELEGSNTPVFCVWQPTQPFCGTSVSL